jgi:bacterioferritin-associated ferredoxin
MYVCLCNRVTDRQIREAARNGCRRLDDLRGRLGVAACCGSCADMAEELLEESGTDSGTLPYALPQPA